MLRFPRIIWPVAALVLLIIVSFLSWPFPTRASKVALSDALKSSFSEQTQYHISRIALLPSPHVRLKAINFKNMNAGIQLSAPRATASIRLLGLLAGRIELDEIAIISPSILISPGLHVEAASRAQLGQIIGALISSFSDGPTLGVQITDGTVYLRNADTNSAPAALFELVNAKVQPRHASDSIKLKATSRWLGNNLALAAIWPMRLPISGDKQRIDIALTSEIFNARFSGQRNADRQATGELEFDTARFPRFLEQVGGGSLGVIAERMRLKSRAELSFSDRAVSEIALTDVQASLDGQVFEGALSFRSGETRPLIAGTLAGKSLDAGRIITRFNLLPKLDETQPSSIFIDPTRISGAADLDLRLSMESAQIGTMQLEQPALQIILNPARFDLNLLQAKGYKGILKARLTTMTGITASDLRLSVGLERIDLGWLNQDIFGSRRLTGTATGQLVIEGIGKTMRDMLSTASGRANISIRQGDMNGFDLADILRRTERQPLSLMKDWRTGRSSFDAAQFSSTIGHGIMDLTEGSITAPAYRMTLNGKIGLRDQDMDLTGLLAGTGQSAISLPFSITGPWGGPAIKSDIRSLIHRSGTIPPQ
jgi:AsmA protein